MSKTQKLMPLRVFNARKPALPAGAVVSDPELEAMIAMAAHEEATSAALAKVSGPTGVVTQLQETTVDGEPEYGPAIAVSEDINVTLTTASDDVYEDDGEEGEEGDGYEYSAEEDEDEDEEDGNVLDEADTDDDDDLDVLKDVLDKADATDAGEGDWSQVEDKRNAWVARMHNAHDDHHEADYMRQAEDDPTDVDVLDQQQEAKEEADAAEARNRLAAHFQLAGEPVARLIVDNLTARQVVDELSKIAPTFGGKAVDMDRIEEAGQHFIDAVESNPDYQEIVDAAQATFSTYVGLAQRAQRMLGGTTVADMLAAKLSGEDFNRAAVDSVKDAMVMRRAVNELRKTISANVDSAKGQLASRQDLVSVIALAAAHLQANQSMMTAAAASLESMQRDLAAAQQAFEQAKADHAKAVEAIHEQTAASIISTKDNRDWRIVSEDGRFMLLRGAPAVDAEGKKHYSLSQVGWGTDVTKALTFKTERGANDFIERVAWSAIAHTANVTALPDAADRSTVENLVTVDGVKIMRCKVGRLAVVVA
jgi:type II secretory pathway pseudopilin PulG